MIEVFEAIAAAGFTTLRILDKSMFSDSPELDCQFDSVSEFWIGTEFTDESQQDAVVGQDWPLMASLPLA